jgi:hypothetical protein
VHCLYWNNQNQSKMNHLKQNYLAFITFVLILSGCAGFSRWTEKEREAFRIKCSETIYFDANPIIFAGFDPEEIDTVVVIEKSNSSIIDTFIMDSPVRISNQDNRYWTKPLTKFNVNHKYEFYIGNDKSYVLDNMEMSMVPEFTHESEDYGCRMRKFTIDGEVFEGMSEIPIVKRK